MLTRYLASPLAVSIVLLAVLFVIPMTSGAQSQEVNTDLRRGPTLAEKVISAFREYRAVTLQDVVVPRVVEVPMIATQGDRYSYAVQDTTTGDFVPSLVRIEERRNELPLAASYMEWESMSVLPGTEMLDNDGRTHIEFPARIEGEGEALVMISSSQAITSSELRIALSPNVALPRTVQLSVDTAEGGERVVVARRPLEGTTIAFPRTEAKVWRILFTHVQPLRIAEIDLIQENAPVVRGTAVRFLAQPGHRYRVFYNADRMVNPPVGEAPNLSQDSEVLYLDAEAGSMNLEYRMSDDDGDGIPDTIDNCTSIFNPDQADTDNNHRGDVCDDWDRDDAQNWSDNCPNDPNRNQSDEDGDGIGDVCDGEESRFTEQHAWIPWAGIGIALLVLVLLFVMSMRHHGESIALGDFGNEGDVKGDGDPPAAA